MSWFFGRQSLTYDCMYSWGLNNVGSLTTVCFFVLHGILLTSAIASMLSAQEQRGGSWASSSVLVNGSSQVPIFRPADSSYCRLFTMKSCFVLMSADCWEKHTVCLRVWGRAAAEPSLPLPLVNRSIVILQEPDENLLPWFMGCHLTGNVHGAHSLPPWIQGEEKPHWGWNQSTVVLDTLAAPQGENWPDVL